MSLNSDKKITLSPFMWAFALALPWLLPTHDDPWTTVYAEMGMAFVMTAMAFRVLCSKQKILQLDAVPFAFILAACIPLFQAVVGILPISFEAPLISLYLLAIAIVVIIARYSEENNPYTLIDHLFAGLAIAAICSSGLALYQWLGLDNAGVLIAPLPFQARPMANVGQPNNLSTLLVWGLVSIWWAVTRKQIGSFGAVCVAAFLLMGIALTQSRTGLLQVGMIGATAWFGRHLLNTSKQKNVWFGLTVWFIFLIFGLNFLSQSLLLESTRALNDQRSVSDRFSIWHMALSAIAQHPWVGYGWNQIVTAHVALAHEFPLHTTVGNAHNLFLDLILWNGLPLGAILIVGLCFWIWHLIKNARTAEQFLILLALGVFGLHAMLELPHVFAYFLLPAAVMLGVLNAQSPLPTVFSVKKSALRLVLLLQFLLLVVMFDEYRRIEAEGINARMRAARIAGAPPASASKFYVLRSLQDSLLTLRTEPKHGMTNEALDHLKHVVIRYPVDAGLLRYAQASALNGRPLEARWAIDVLCSLNSHEQCKNAASLWKEMVDAGNPEMAFVLNAPEWDSVDSK